MLEDFKASDFYFLLSSSVIGFFVFYAVLKRMTTDDVKPAQKTAFALPEKPPKQNFDRKFTPSELKEYDGSHSDKPIYVAIKSMVFDVTGKRELYGPGGSYSVFAGRDASLAFGRGSLKKEDLSPEYEGQLDEGEMKVLNDWVEYFKKRYDIVGVVSE
jgi:predicted heme/steroid binding protein